MVTIDTEFTSPSFISHCKTGFISHEPSIRVCIVEFDVNYYNNALFTSLMIPLPEAIMLSTLKRRVEYLAGRYAAHNLLKEMGCFNAVTTGPDRAPVWPDGWFGGR